VLENSWYLHGNHIRIYTITHECSSYGDKTYSSSSTLPLLPITTTNRSIQSPDPPIIPPLLHPRLNPRPHQQTPRREDENKHHRLIFPAISLEACGEDIVFFRALADWEVVVETELLVAVVAGAAFWGLATVPFARGGFGGLGVVERDDGRVGEAGAFAEGGWCW
jgi:hypothetical protein